MTDRASLTATFAIRYGIQFRHRPSGSAIDLRPWPDLPVEQTEAARRELFDLMHAALPDSWHVERMALGPVDPPGEEPYADDPVRHWARIDTMIARLREAGVDGAGEVAHLPAGWLTPMERAVGGIVAILREAGPPAGLRINQIKEKFGTLRFYAGVTGEVADRSDLDRIVDWAELATQGRCMVTGGPGTIERRGWLLTLSPEMRRLDGSDPRRLRRLIYPGRPGEGDPLA